MFEYEFIITLYIDDKITKKRKAIDNLSDKDKGIVTYI